MFRYGRGYCGGTSIGQRLGATVAAYPVVPGSTISSAGPVSEA